MFGDRILRNVKKERERTRGHWTTRILKKSPRERAVGETRDGTRVEKRSEGGSMMTRRRRPEITAGMRVQ